MSPLNLYEERFKKFINKYFANHEVPSIHGFFVHDSFEEIEIDAALIQERLLNVFKDTLAEYTFTETEHPEFQQVVFDALDRFFETTLQTFEIHDKEEIEKLEVILGELQMRILQEAVQELKEKRENREAGLEGKIVKFERPEGGRSRNR